ncbi:hypothetical protein NQ317_011508 [Molorchus minor]|uniref:Uncharacterized protein n=1 Tax=Molorchus minor TaxID=1323400 RepID=A0ABQ9IUN1_9CUCU|nr:hypothetical protein NQ317_011508 [Molorchus minor]
MNTLILVVAALAATASASIHGVALHGAVAVHPYAHSPVGPSGIVTGYGAHGPSGTVTGAGAVGPSGIVTGHGAIGPNGPNGQGHHGVVVAAPVVAAAPLVAAAPVVVGHHGWGGHGALGLGHGGWGLAGHGLAHGVHGW